ncbi:MAG: zf-HC2 domain-containing protein [Actinomycetota bacterium]
MNTPAHDQERLSAYLDGELEFAARAEVDAHLGECGSCRATLAALRTTVADLRALEEPAPSAQDSWALRAAVARARRSQVRRVRLPLAIGGVAAALIAFAAVTMRGPEPVSGSGTAEMALGARPPILLLEQDFDAASARDLLAGDPTSVTSYRGATADSAAPGSPQVPEQALPVQSDSGSLKSRSTAAGSVRGDTAGVSACEKAIFSKDAPQALSYIDARFEGRPAYLLVYELASPARLELWVVSQDSCEVLFFAQRKR